MADKTPDRLEQEHADLQTKHAELQARHADVMSEGGSYRNLQVSLDAALQKHHDDKAAHDAAVAKMANDHKSATEAMADQHAKDVADLMGRVAQLTNQVGALKAQIGTLTAENEALKKQQIAEPKQ